MKKLITIVALAILIFACNTNNSEKTNIATTDSAKIINDSFKTSTVKSVSVLDSLPPGMEDGTAIMRNGKILVKYDTTLLEMSNKEMMMHEIQMNDKGEMVIVDGKRKIPFTEGMMVDKNDNILVMKDGKLMKMKDGKWIAY